MKNIPPSVILFSILVIGTTWIEYHYGNPEIVWITKLFKGELHWR